MCGQIDTQRERDRNGQGYILTIHCCRKPPVSHQTDGVRVFVPNDIQWCFTLDTTLEGDIRADIAC